MNYSKIYGSLIERAKYRDLSGSYYERHHIIPRCMGGTNEPGNIVRLTAEEHFVAHELLVKIHPKENRLVYGMLAMTMNINGKRPNNKTFGWIRRLIAKTLSEDRTGVPRNREMMEKIWAGWRGSSLLPHQVEKMKRSLKGRVKSAAHLAAISAACKGRKSPMEGRTHSDETKQKMREKATGRKMSHEAVKKMIATKGPEQRRAGALKAWETKRAKATLGV